MASPNRGSHGSGSGPSIGFPLGTALVLLVIFSLSGILSCCYHWDKLRRSFSSHPNRRVVGPSKPATAPSMDVKLRQNESMPVIMAGDSIPKFIALPCPCEHPPMGKMTVELQRPPLPLAAGDCCPFVLIN